MGLSRVGAYNREFVPSGIHYGVDVLKEGVGYETKMQAAIDNPYSFGVDRVSRVGLQLQTVPRGQASDVVAGLRRSVPDSVGEKASGSVAGTAVEG